MYCASLRLRHMTAAAAATAACSRHFTLSKDTWPPLLLYTLRSDGQQAMAGHCVYRSQVQFQPSRMPQSSDLAAGATKSNMQLLVIEPLQPEPMKALGNAMGDSGCGFRAAHCGSRNINEPPGEDSPVIQIHEWCGVQSMSLLHPGLACCCLQRQYRMPIYSQYRIRPERHQCSGDRMGTRTRCKCLPPAAEVQAAPMRARHLQGATPPVSPNRCMPFVVLLDVTYVLYSTLLDVKSAYRASAH